MNSNSCSPKRNNSTYEICKIALITFILFNLLVGYQSLTAQNIYNQEEGVLKPLVLIGTEVFIMDEYCNNRFEYCVSYPESLFDKRQKTTNNDGRTWTSEDGDIRLTVYGTHSLDWTLKEEYHRWREILRANSNEDLNLKTSILHDNYFELIGISNGENYYQKTYLDREDNQFVTLIFRSTKADLDYEQLYGLQQTIADSFKIQ